jgi:Calcium binding
MVCSESPARLEWIAMVEWFGRPEIETDEVRERRISMEAVDDAYNELERAIGWYYYLEGKFDFPFLARCGDRRSTSPLKVGDEVEVIGMAPVEEGRSRNVRRDGLGRGRIGGPSLPARSD